MRTKTAARKRAGTAGQRCAWISLTQRELSDQVHAAGDDRARKHGWDVTKTTGRFGFGARRYRDPRFDDRRRQASSGTAHVFAEHDHAEVSREEAEVQR
jgi:hypothetical protein